jgi:predicted ribosome quality control (RQC) complex YloA/Tae2 family protein
MQVNFILYAKFIEKGVFMEIFIEKLLTLKEQILKETARAKRRLAKQNIEFEKSKNWEIYKNFADTILINKNSIKKGTPLVELSDAAGQNVKIELNTAISVVENAEMYYKKMRKGKRGCEKCGENIKMEELKIVEFQKLLEKVCDFLDNGFLGRENEVENFLDLHLCKSAQTENDNKKIEKTHFRHYNYKGYDIYAGKTSGDNDELSTKFANPFDIWFHAVGYAGSHLIIRRKKGEPFPPNDILSIAGGIAVFFSKAKNCGYAEVHFTEARFVRKPRKSPTGLVVAERCKTMRVSPIDPQKLFKELKNES